MKGSVRKPRSSGGKWSYRLDLGYDDAGKRRQREVGNFSTKREAQAGLNESLAELQRGSYVAPSRQTVRDYLDSWITTARSELAETAWTNYRNVVRAYIVPYLGSKRLTDLSALDIKKWHGELLDHGRKDGRPLAVNSVKLAHRVLHRALADGVRWNVIAANPATSVRVPRSDHKPMNVWTPDEARRFLHATAHDRTSALWLVALHTGMRRGELAGLRWSDVDLDRGTLTVAQQRTSADRQVIVAPPKARSHRQLLLAEPTVDALREHCDLQETERAALGPAWPNSGYVFVDEVGEPFHPERLTKMFAKAIEKTAMPRIRLHDLRHTMATSALAAGVHPKIVQEQLGHSTIAITLDTYSQVPQAVRRESAGQIARLYNNPD